ncbi:MAG: DNA repair protein RecN [Bacteroidales bacterium]|nr:DNA repair protein RecN [Bacteroidales bacterium]
MLKRLTIQNYALIDSLDISFPGNLVIITGETGAGKSILLGALSLLLGMKADVTALSNKERNCVVEAEFITDGHEKILRRVVSPQGRSRVFLDDEPVGMDELKEISSGLIDIHAQHQQLLLADKKFQMQVLDNFAGIASDVESYASDYNRYVSLAKELKVLDDKISQDEKEREYLEFQYQQLSEAKLIDGECEELEAEQGQLSHSEEIKEAIFRIGELFNGDEEDSVNLKLKEMEALLEKLSGFIPSFAELFSRLSSARIELKDVEQEVSNAGEKITYSPERLAFVDERLALIYDLLRKHGASKVSELIAYRDDVSDKLGKGVDLINEKETIHKQLDAQKQKCAEAADLIRSKRLAAAPRLSDTLQEAIRALEMPLAQFEVRVEELPQWGRDGKDDVQFYFSANGGIALKELAKCASGGELSRIMLCIKALMAKYVGMPTMIFDEIDTGVSGSIADKMGDLVGEMGRNMQVFAITHLPQVASKGNAHYLVYKELNDNHEACTKIRKIDGKERVLEIARMLSGATLTEEAVANAKVLLREN